jgi:hypothetical protein
MSAEKSNPKKNKRVTFKSAPLVRQISNEWAKFDNLVNTQTPSEYKNAKKENNIETRDVRDRKHGQIKFAEKPDKDYPNFIVTPYAKETSVILLKKSANPSRKDFTDFQDAVAKYNAQSKSSPSKSKKGGRKSKKGGRKSKKRTLKRRLKR